MTETLNKIIVDCATGEQTIVPLTSEEIAQRATLQAEFEAAEEARATEEARIAALKTSAKAKLVAGTALTADEAAVLTGL